MKSTKNSGKLLVACIAFVSIIALVKAAYYQPDFFPIGLTGLNPTEQDGIDKCPYGGILDGQLNPLWKWENNAPYPDQTERKLIFDLGINCIGGQDAKPDYLVDLDPNDPDDNNYLNKVCMEADSAIYIFTSGYFVSNPPVFMCCSDTIINGNDTTYLDSVPCDTFNYGRVKTGPSWGNQSTYYLFHSPYRPDLAGYGSMLFTYHGPSHCDTCIGPHWGCHGSKVYNWNTFDGDTLWRHQIADTAVKNWAGRFGGAYSADINYIWGYNLLSEDPACYNGASPDGQWQGCWAAVDRIINGDNTKFSIPEDSQATHTGIRGAEDSLNIDHRMVFAKAVLPIWKYANINVFQYIPDIDVVYAFPHGMIHAHWNYGCDSIFDNWLYGTYAHVYGKEQERGGWHDWAVYMQRYGKTNLAYSDQKRRWIATLCLEWQIYQNHQTQARARRPCPPEIRCLTYLSLSRGAKGVLFHPWSYNYTGLSNTLDPSTIDIPCDPISDSPYNLGLRDQAGYPFGEGGPYDYTHKLNGGCSLEVWDTASDTTYAYLCHLIPEIKAISDVLMQLEWVNAYSLNSIAPDWHSPCPHYYVEDVWGVEFMDLAFFDHPYEPIGVEYFMMVNREGIADMTNRTVSVALDANHWPEEDTLILTDIANADNPRRLTRVGERFTFTEFFEPGEGKLYRVAPVNEAPIVLVQSTEGGVR